MMAGLVAYESSDEDENVPVASNEVQENSKAIEESIERRTDAKHLDQSENGNSKHNEAANNRAPVSLVAPQAPIEGPTLGPTIPQDKTSPPPEEIGREDSAPQSPYTATRSLLRELTMPSVPSLDIPPSPPGSPPPGPNARFAHFLELKKQGVHFNEKLAKSSALKNPSLMQKLMDFADIDDVGQYATTLPLDFWDPNVFPKLAYKEELAKSQQKILKNREEEIAMGNRTAVEFVPGAASGDSSRSGTLSDSWGEACRKAQQKELWRGWMEDGRALHSYKQGRSGNIRGLIPEINDAQSLTVTTSSKVALKHSICLKNHLPFRMWVLNAVHEICLDLPKDQGHRSKLLELQDTINVLNRWPRSVTELREQEDTIGH